MLNKINWIERRAAAKALNVCERQMVNIAKSNGLSVTTLGKFTYYKISEINEMFERRQSVKKVA